MSWRRMDRDVRKREWWHKLSEIYPQEASQALASFSNS
jgi:hypothetical protein